MEKSYWNPYFGGVVLGTMLFLTFLIASQGFGASGTFSRGVAQILVSMDTSWLENAYIANYFRHSDSSLINWTVFETIGVFLGGFISALLAGRFMIKPDKAESYPLMKRFLLAFIGGAIIAFATRLTRGCTSGQGLNGMVTFSVGAWIFMFMAFAGALMASPLFKSQWVEKERGDKSNE
jgi:uncharacterized membrane protein YedE/YeeE